MTQLKAKHRNNYNVVLSLIGPGKWNVETLEKLPEGVQPQISVEELIAAEQIVRNDPKVQELARAVGGCNHSCHRDVRIIHFPQAFFRSKSIAMDGLSATTIVSRKVDGSNRL